MKFLLSLVITILLQVMHLSICTPTPPSRDYVGQWWGFELFNCQLPHPQGMSRCQIPIIYPGCHRQGPHHSFIALTLSLFFSLSLPLLVFSFSVAMPVDLGSFPILPAALLKRWSMLLPHCCYGQDKMASRLEADYSTSISSPSQSFR